MKVSDLSGAELDYWVIKAGGREARFLAEVAQILRPQYEHRGIGSIWFTFQPSTEWRDGGPIIERELIGLQAVADGWFAGICRPPAPGMRDGRGPTPLIAAMRCFVASKFGENVEELPQLVGTQVTTR